MKNDLQEERPKWPISSYVAVKGGKPLIENCDISPEELRYKYLIAQKSGQIQQYVRIKIYMKEKNNKNKLIYLYMQIKKSILYCVYCIALYYFYYIILYYIILYYIILYYIALYYLIEHEYSRNIAEN